MDEELLASGLERIGIACDDIILNRLKTHVEEVVLFNPAYKLVGDTEPDEIIIRHVLDSAAAFPVFMRETKPGDTIADLGSGAGFPGIVLASLMPDRTFVLIERMRRRSLFLSGVIARCRLGNASVLESELRMVDRRFDAITCRAFHPVYDSADEMLSVLDASGAAILYKGQRANALSELDVLRGEGYSFDAGAENIRVPYLDETRTICVLRNWKK